MLLKSILRFNLIFQKFVVTILILHIDILIPIFASKKRFITSSLLTDKLEMIFCRIKVEFEMKKENLEDQWCEVRLVRKKLMGFSKEILAKM